MAWDDELPTIVRGLMLDDGDTRTYTDDRYASLILVTAVSLVREVTFPQAYDVDISNGTIRPDPTKNPRDPDFINLACLKAALNLVKAELRDMTRQGIEIQDGSSRLKLARDPNALRLMYQSYLDQYEKALREFQAGISGGQGGHGEAVVSPYPYFSEFPRWTDPRDRGCY